MADLSEYEAVIRGVCIEAGVDPDVPGPLAIATDLVQREQAALRQRIEQKQAEITPGIEAMVRAAYGFSSDRTP